MAQDITGDEDVTKQGCRGRFNSWWKNVKITIWNAEKKEFLGRTGSSWAAIILFYIGYFLFTCGFFAVCFAIFMKTIDSRVPTHQKYYSMLKYNPGMNYLPRWDLNTEYVGFDSSKNESFMKKYIPSLENEIERYANATQLMICNEQTSSTFDEACRFNISSLGRECTKENMFGYPEGKPCFFLRINNIYGWNPVDDALKPGDISCHGDDDISNECQFFNIPKTLKSTVNSQYIPVSCEGETPVDQDNLIEVQFNPPNGIPMNFFPYYNQPGYLPPMVAAKFKVTRGITVMISCKFWTKNVKHDIDDRQGSFHLELMVDGSFDYTFDNTNISYTTATVEFTKNISEESSTSQPLMESTDNEPRKEEHSTDDKTIVNEQTTKKYESSQPDNIIQESLSSSLPQYPKESSVIGTRVKELTTATQ